MCNTEDDRRKKNNEMKQDNKQRTKDASSEKNECKITKRNETGKCSKRNFGNKIH